MYSKNRFFLLILLMIIAIDVRSAQAFNVTLNNSGNVVEYDDDNNIGLTSWQVDEQVLLTQTGWFYRLNDVNIAKSLSNLLEGILIDNGTTATLPYTDDNFTLDLNLSLKNNGSTLNQIVTVQNTSNTENLIFDLYFYGELNTSNGLGGDTVAIDPNNYTASQSGDRKIITTTVNQNNLNYTRTAEVDVIDFSDDTLRDKLQYPLSGNTPNLDGTLNATSIEKLVSFAYQWNYNLAADESFEIEINSDVTAVPFEFSPGFGLLLSAIFGFTSYLKQKII